MKLQHTRTGTHEFHTFGIRALHIDLGVTKTVIQSHPCCHRFRISIVNNKTVLVTLQLVLPCLPLFQGYDTVWFVSDVTTLGTMISVNRALWMTSQTFATGFSVAMVPMVGTDVDLRRQNRVSMVTRFLGLHQSDISDITTGFSMVMIEVGL